MFAAVMKSNRLDSIAIGLSGLCVAHCVMTAVLLTILASASSVLLHPVFHEVGLIAAIVLGGIALGRGIVQHGRALPAWIGSLGLGVMAGAMTLGHGGNEAIVSVMGVMIVAFGHELNRRAIKPPELQKAF